MRVPSVYREARFSILIPDGARYLTLILPLDVAHKLADTGGLRIDWGTQTDAARIEWRISGIFYSDETENGSGSSP